MTRDDPEGFKAIFHEVCMMDCYGVRDLPFVPDVVVDIGAMVGVFTSYARYLFPGAEIVALEPNPQNWEYLERFTGHLPRVTRINKAMGLDGPMWHQPTEDAIAEHDARHPPGEAPYTGGIHTYTSAGFGYPDQKLETLGWFERCSVEVISLDALVAEYVPEGAKAILKVDCEGGENCLYHHEPSMAALRRMCYIAIEVHYFSFDPSENYEANKQIMRNALLSLVDTHVCELDDERHQFHATRKGP